MQQDLTNTMNQLDELLKKADLSKVSADGAGFEDLPDGYYLCEVETAELKSTKSRVVQGVETGLKPMVSYRYKVFEDGLKQSVDENGDTELIIAKGTKNRKVFINYVLTDESQLNRYVSDMLKFEIDGEPILTKDCFIDSATMVDSIEATVGSTIYIMVQSYEKNGELKKNYYLVKWSTAKDLDLPM